MTIEEERTLLWRTLFVIAGLNCFSFAAQVTNLFDFENEDGDLFRVVAVCLTFVSFLLVPRALGIVDNSKTHREAK